MFRNNFVTQINCMKMKNSRWILKSENYKNYWRKDISIPVDYLNQHLLNDSWVSTLKTYIITETQTIWVQVINPLLYILNNEAMRLLGKEVLLSVIDQNKQHPNLLLLNWMKVSLCPYSGILLRRLSSWIFFHIVGLLHLSHV